MANVDSPGDQTGHMVPISLMAKVAGVKDEIAYNSNDLGSIGRHAMIVRGRWNLFPPLCLAALATVAGYVVAGYVGLCFGPMFFVANLAIQSIVNPLISELKARYVKWLAIAITTIFTYLLLLVSGIFAATLVAWLFFKPTIDQRLRDEVVSVMQASQEKQALTFAEDALSKERANMLSKQQVSSSAIDRASAAYNQAQDVVAKANATYQEELARGQGGSRPGDGPKAKALWQSLLTARASEESAKKALDEARAQVVAPSPELTKLAEAHDVAKARYEAKEKALTEAGPGLLKTFWWLLEVVHKEPGLIAFVFVYAFFEAYPVIAHSLAGINAYERVRHRTIQDEAEVRREMHRRRQERLKEDALHKAEVISAKAAARQLSIEAKDRTKR